MPRNCVNDQILWPYDGSLIPSGLLQTIEMTLHYPLEMSPYSLVKIVTKWLSLWCFLSSLVLVLLFLGIFKFYLQMLSAFSFSSFLF